MLALSHKSFFDVVETVDHVMTGMELVMLATSVLTTGTKPVMLAMEALMTAMSLVMTATYYSHKKPDLLTCFITIMKQELLFARVDDCRLAEIHTNSGHQ